MIGAAMVSRPFLIRVSEGGLCGFVAVSSVAGETTAALRYMPPFIGTTQGLADWFSFGRQSDVEPSHSKDPLGPEAGPPY